VNLLFQKKFAIGRLKEKMFGDRRNPKLMYEISNISKKYILEFQIPILEVE
jgi:hypothetical protein